MDWLSMLAAGFAVYISSYMAVRMLMKLIVPLIDSPPKEIDITPLVDALQGSKSKKVRRPEPTSLHDLFYDEAEKDIQ